MVSESLDKVISVSSGGLPAEAQAYWFENISWDLRGGYHGLHELILTNANFHMSKTTRNL